MGSLQERLDEFKKSFESGAPPYNAPHEVIDKMHRATAELKATGIEDRAPTSPCSQTVQQLQALSSAAAD